MFVTTFHVLMSTDAHGWRIHSMITMHSDELQLTEWRRAHLFKRPRAGFGWYLTAFVSPRSGVWTFRCLRMVLISAGMGFDAFCKQVMYQPVCSGVALLTLDSICATR